MPSKKNIETQRNLRVNCSVRYFFHELKQLLFGFRYIKDAFRSGRVSRQFAERVMLAVATADGCEYCVFGHTGSSLKSGVSSEEITAIMTYTFDGRYFEEVVALDFAKHYVESNQSPSKNGLKQLVNTYGLEKARDIMILIKIVSFGNLIGNLVEDFENRKKGLQGAQNCPLLFEAAIYRLAGPFFRKMKRDGQRIILQKNSFLGKQLSHQR